ncbi:MAG: hypothetical protein N2560_10360, partial [Ignavibacteria bacterium]|nr:hypothetical protein [Ignavibacteria bacterium]
MMVNILRRLIILLIFSFQFTYSYNKNDSTRFFEKEGNFFSVFRYIDKNIDITGNPILGLSLENLFNHKQMTTTWGINIVGKHNSGVSFSFIFHDNIVYGSDYYNKIDFLNKPGRVLTVNTNKRSEFSETRGHIGYENDFVTIK